MKSLIQRNRATSPSCKCTRPPYSSPGPTLQRKQKIIAVPQLAISSYTYSSHQPGAHRMRNQKRLMLYLSPCHPASEVPITLLTSPSSEMHGADIFWPNGMQISIFSALGLSANVCASIQAHECARISLRLSLCVCPCVSSCASMHLCPCVHACMHLKRQP